MAASADNIVFKRRVGPSANITPAWTRAHQNYAAINNMSADKEQKKDNTFGDS